MFWVCPTRMGPQDWPRIESFSCFGNTLIQRPGWRRLNFSRSARRWMESHLATLKAKHWVTSKKAEWLTPTQPKSSNRRTNRAKWTQLDLCPLSAPRAMGFVVCRAMPCRAVPHPVFVCDVMRGRAPVEGSHRWFFPCRCPFPASTQWNTWDSQLGGQEKEGQEGEDMQS